VPRTYLDFDLLIERTEAGYRARVLDSPGGQATVEFSLPFSALEMENFLLRITRSLGDMRRSVRRLGSPERELVRGFGSQLFGAVFSGAVHGALQSSLNEAYRKDAGLRFRLRLTDTPELADVPWEFLHNPASNQFLSLSPDTPLVRYLDLPIAARPFGVTPPIRVLVMISSPTDFPQLDVAAEWNRLDSSLHDLIERGLVSLTRLPNATLAGLQRPLRLGQYHIFHFVGHGGFDAQSQDGALVLEDDRGRGRLVSGQDLGVMLTGHRSLRLVVLNACEGARSSSSDPFSGVAQTLIQQAIPAVIAMQFEITDDAAITFAHEFYGAVADGYPVDAALAESRRAIFARGNEFEWATPVLYMRSPNGQLFRLTRTSPAALREAAEREAAEQRARDQAEREAAEQRARDQAERDAAEQRARDQAERDAAEQQARDQAERDAAEQQAQDQAERDAAEQRARDQAERDAAEQRARDQAEREAAERAMPSAEHLLADTGAAEADAGAGIPAGEVEGAEGAAAEDVGLGSASVGLEPARRRKRRTRWVWGVAAVVVLMVAALVVVAQISGQECAQDASNAPAFPASFETGLEGWIPRESGTGCTSQASDFVTDGSYSLQIDSVSDEGGWYGTEFEDPIDISDASEMSVDVKTLEVGTETAIAVQLGDDWTWCEPPDWGAAEAASDWLPVTLELDLETMNCTDGPPPSDLSELQAVWVWFNGTGSFRIDNVRAE
jgi:CHAT domain